MMRSSHSHPGRQRGFSLIELLIAGALSLLVMAGVAIVFASTSANRSEIERGGRLTQNAAHALSLLSEEIRLAGYFGETNPTGVAWQAPDACATAMASLGWSAMPFTQPMPIVGYRSADETPGCLARRKPGTAAFTIRRLDVDTTSAASASGAPFWQASSCGSDAAANAYSNVRAAFTLRKYDCTAAADIRKVVVRSYFVSACNDCASDSVPTLKRVELLGDAMRVTPLVEGIENLQIEYGFDTDNDGNADVFREGLSGVEDAPDNTWTNVVAARVFLLARTTDTTPGYLDATRRFFMGPAGYTSAAGDAHKRVQLSAVVRINNQAGRRER
jgi:type IV pilus assembly protein PilW